MKGLIATAADRKSAMFRRSRVLRNGLAVVSASTLAASLIAAVPASAATSADIAVTNSASAPRIPGGVFVNETFTITVTNLGQDQAQNVAMSDSTIFEGITAPAGVSCATPPTNSWGTTTCTTPSLKPGAAITIWLRGKVLAMHNQCVLGNVARATSATPDPNLNNNTATAVIRSTQLRCLQSAPAR
jgi:uncharacterized repeat protein (TIGR01451 family)